MKIPEEKITAFQKFIWDYYKKHKRDLPWRRTENPYHIVVSEVMLQQTQVSRIIPKYESFLKQFPDFYSLASSSLTDLLREWKGIGYNRRALYLRSLAEIVVKKYNGVLPQDPIILETFPGIGTATAGSICVYAFNLPLPFIETNVRKIYIYHFFQDKENIHDKEIMPYIEKTLDKKNPREWYWALMDYGVYLSKAIPNPNKRSKHYVKQSKFEGSNRQLRGKILEFLLTNKSGSEEAFIRIIKDEERTKKVLDELVREKFVIKKRGVYTIA